MNKVIGSWLMILVVVLLFGLASYCRFLSLENRRLAAQHNQVAATGAAKTVQKHVTFRPVLRSSEAQSTNIGWATAVSTPSGVLVEASVKLDY